MSQEFQVRNRYDQTGTPQKDKIITPLIDQGQSPYQIVANHPELNLSVRSVYNYLDMGLLTARNVDLKRKSEV